MIICVAILRRFTLFLLRDWVQNSLWDYIKLRLLKIKFTNRDKYCLYHKDSLLLQKFTPINNYKLSYNYKFTSINLQNDRLLLLKTPLKPEKTNVSSVVSFMIINSFNNDEIVKALAKFPEKSSSSSSLLNI